jgi:glycerophosphoryl diester phosphodiesterase
MTTRIVVILLGCLTCLASSGVWAFDLEGHRGTRGLAPENTLPAFARALTLGVDTLELDVGVTKDGVFVVSHNRVLDPVITKGPDGAWLAAPGPAIRTLTAAELRRYDVGGIKPQTEYARQFPAQQSVPGTPIPTFAELAALVRKAGNETVRFNVETKLSPLAPDETLDPESFAVALVAVLRSTGLVQRTTIQSFDWRTLKVVQRLAPEIETVCLTFERGRDDNIQRGMPGPSPWTGGLDVDDFGGSVPRLVKAAGCAIWSPFFRDVTDAALAEAKSLGLRTVAWTVNDPADMASLIERGVDGLISDYPDRVRAVMAARGMTLPVSTPVTP